MIANKNARIVVVLVLIAGTMLGVAYASVPLYTMFCKATGFLGTTQRVNTVAVKPIERMVTVTFDTNVDKNLPWDFAPDLHSVQVKLGETKTVTFRAHNHGDKTLTGMATFNVQPDKAGQYFNKIQCFCFDGQTLKPNESEEMEVEFYVDPAMAKDKDTDDVTNITLSYTFFLSKDQNASPKAPKPNIKITEPTNAPLKKIGNAS